MNIPDVFQQLAVYFHQDADTAYKNLEELVHNALYSYTIEQRQALKDFMYELTSGNYDETQLREVWLRSKAEVLPFWGSEGSCAEFLLNLRRLVENDVPPSRQRS
jgi:hypothetical protein